MRTIGKSICLLAISAGLSAATVGCGSSSDDSTSLFDGGVSGGGDSSVSSSSSGAGGSSSGSGADASMSADTSTPVLVVDGSGGGGCVSKTCASLGFSCGPNNDGCGNVIDCGACPTDQYCGGGGYSKCGTGIASSSSGGSGDSGTASADGGTTSSCTTVTCLALGFTCGQTGNGCGGIQDCGTCTGNEFCGGGGFSRCGTGVTADGGQACTPKTCADLHYNCGAAGDGCGNPIDCGTCPTPQICGGGGFNTCGAGGSTSSSDAGDAGTTVVCTPKTCADLGFNCGPAGDGCGGPLSCGTCGGTDICGGAGHPGVCGNSVVCNNLCSQQVSCDAGTPTTITGIVRAGISAWTGLTPDPVPNVLVYVPNAPLTSFTPGASCRQCGADVSGSPLVSTYTDFDGTFTLQNVPAGSSIPVVIQLGRWRSQFRVNAPACTSSTVGTLNLPRNQSEGDLPLTAISTGSVDALECVLLKMGIDQTEFTADTAAGGTGRVHIYAGDPGPNGGNPKNGAPGATVTNARNEPALMGTGGSFMNYDQIMFPCWGDAATKTAAELANLVTYSDSGGHFFATHYSYSWLVGNGEFDTVANWNPNFDNPGTVNWTLGASTVVPPSPPSPRTEMFAKWLNYVGALSNSGATVPSNPQVSIGNPRHDADSVKNGSVDWIDGTDQRANSNNFHGNGTALVEHFTFNTPVGQANQCGHDIFSDFHVTNANNTNGTTFPGECDRAFAPQEKILEFMIWDLASCVPPPPSPSCTPVTCGQQGISCGPAGNGCGGSIDCGQCPTGQQCGGNGVYGVCVPIPDAGSGGGPTCTPKTCADQGIACGPAGDGCGASLDCGTCTAPMTCGGGGVAGQCGGSGCTPITCAQQNITCGPAGDGCGALLQCGTCQGGQNCGGGGVAGQCGGATCTALTCAQLNINCGPAGDGCGGLLECGTCATNESCGGGGVPGQCGGVAM